MAVDVEAIDTRTASDETLRRLHELYVFVEADDLPDDPPTPYERRALDWQNISETDKVLRWLLTDGGIPAAAGVLSLSMDQNLENGFARVFVRPGYRGRGHAKRLSEIILDALDENERKRVNTYTRVGSDNGGFAERFGLRNVLEDRRSRLRIADLDMDLMASWIERAPERASEYELLYLESPYPEEVLQKYCDLAFIMNTAPRGDFEMEDWVITPEWWRDTEATNEARATDLHTYVAVHSPTGDFAGYTTIQTDRLQPEQAWQWDTGVHPEHRNKGLGRWLKAALVQKVLAEHPAVDRIDTWNAGSNRPMLAINVEMGFEGILEAANWQGEVGLARESL